MSQRRKLLEQQYLFGLEKKEKAQPSNQLLEKECSECGSKAMACFTDDGGKNWYCYGHRPEATERERQEQTDTNREVHEAIRRRLAKSGEGNRQDDTQRERMDRRSRFSSPPRHTSDEEDYSWCF